MSVKVPRTGDRRVDLALKSIVKQLEKDQETQDRAITVAASTGSGSTSTGGDSFLEWAGL